MSSAARTPIWVKAGLITGVLAGGGWLWLQHAHRLALQGKLSAVASAIAGRTVEARCPGVISRLIRFDLAGGTVGFDAGGRPSDHTDLSGQTCSALDGLAGADLDCVEDPANVCPDAAAKRVLAVDVLAHESQHLRGIMSEATAECYALQYMPFVAERLGIAPDRARQMAVWEWENTYNDLGDAYRTNACVPGGPLDLTPRDGRWP